MPQAEKPPSTLRRAFLTAPAAALLPGPALAAAVTIGRGAAPAGKIWVCVDQVAWESLVEASLALMQLEQP